MSSPSSSAPTTDTAFTDARPVQIKAGTASYEALVGPGASAEIGPALERAGLKGRPRVIADRHIWQRYGADLQPFLDTGLLKRQNRRLWLTRRGMLLAHEVMTVFV